MRGRWLLLPLPVALALVGDGCKRALDGPAPGDPPSPPPTDAAPPLNDQDAREALGSPTPSVVVDEAEGAATTTTTTTTATG